MEHTKKFTIASWTLRGIAAICIGGGLGGAMLVETDA